MSDKPNNPLPVFGLLPVSFRLELIGEWHGATCVARSCLVEGQRVIRVGLCSSHLLVDRALQRGDTPTIRFLIGLSLVEYCAFWSSARDGASVRNGLKKLAGLSSGDQAFGSGFASQLAIAEEMKSVDGMPVFGRSPVPGPHGVVHHHGTAKSPSDITNWARNGLAEKPKPIPPKVPKSSPAVAPPPVAVIDPFLERFHSTAKEILDEATFRSLEELTKGAADA